jgi:hypothetical protein
MEWDGKDRRLVMHELEPKYVERISHLETSVEGIKGSLNEIRNSLIGLQETLGKSKETNWTVIFAGAAVIGSLYAAAIRPLTIDIERQSHAAETLAVAVVASDTKISDARGEILKLDALVDQNRRTLEEIKKDGTPEADKRLLLVEYRLDKLEKGK